MFDESSYSYLYQDKPTDELDFVSEEISGGVA
jgi:hypothetical protein